MTYALDCDTCGFTRMVDEEARTYVLAKDHEGANPDHFVMIETVA